MNIRFTWSDKKASANKRKHGISFETAVEVFGDPNQVVMNNYFITDEGEQRLQIIGMTKGLVLLVVIFVDRTDPENEIIHVISARKAVKYEETIYAAAQAQND